MSNNSNQTGALLLLAVVLGITVYTLMFFGNEVEQTNVSASFGQLTKSSSKNLYSGNSAATPSENTLTERSEKLRMGVIPSYKMGSTSGGDYKQTENPDFPTTGIALLDVQNMNSGTVTSRRNSTINYAQNNQRLVLGNANVEYISNPQNPTKADISALLILDTRAAESAMASQQGSKRATPALAGKTASASTDATGKQSSKKAPGDPGDPGASLPIGNGVYVLLLFAVIYASNKHSKEIQQA